MKGGTPPTPPDPVATAAAQTKSNNQTAAFQQSLNMVNQNTPLGSLTYTQENAGDPSNGIPPQYTATTTLNPTGQKEFDLQQQTGAALDNLALSGAGQVQDAMGKAQNYSGLPGSTTINPGQLPSLPSYDAAFLNSKAPTANQDDYNNAQKALYSQFTTNLDPQWAQQEKTLKDSLSQKGVLEGSDAYNTAMNNFQLQKTQAYQTAQNNSVTGASNIESQQFGMGQQAYQDLAANALNSANMQGSNYERSLGTQQAVNASNLASRQQGISEANYLRELPINEVTALLHGGQVSQPTFNNTPQAQVANTNVAGITQSSFQDAEQNYQQQMQQQNAMIGAVFGAAGSALGGWATGGFA